MGIANTIYAMRKRLRSDEIEKMLNILEDERQRRGLFRDDEIKTTKDFKKV